MAEELSIENEADFVKKRLLSAILALAMTAACLTACSESNDSSQMQSAADSSARASHSDGEFSLPKGADSEYELYQTVINYLNNGFHLDDLNSVRSVELTTVFWQKNQEKEKGEQPVKAYSPEHSVFLVFPWAPARNFAHRRSDAQHPHTVLPTNSTKIPELTLVST